MVGSRDHHSGILSQKEPSMISSNKIHRLRQILYIPVTSFQGLGASTAVFDSVGAGDPVFQEINSLGINGCLTPDDNDDIRHFMRIPTNWDRDNNIYVRFIFTTESVTAADTITWKFLYALLTPGTDAFAAPATVLDTVLVAQAVTGTTRTLERTSTPGVLKGGTISDADLYMSFTCSKLSDVGISESIFFLGVEFEFTVKQDHGNLIVEPEAWTP